MECGVRDREFFSFSLPQFCALYRAWRDREFREYERAGIIAHVTAEVNRDRDARREPFCPADFMPGWIAPKKPVKSADDIYAAMKAWQLGQNAREHVENER